MRSSRVNIPGIYVRAVAVGILGSLIIAALVIIDASEGRKLYAETNASSIPTPTPEGQLFGLFLLLILGTIFVIGMTGFISVLIQRGNECTNLKDAILIAGLAGSIPCLIITMATMAMAIYELLFLAPGVNANAVILSAAGMLVTLATFVLVVLISIIFGIIALAVRKMTKKAD